MIDLTGSETATFNPYAYLHGASRGDLCALRVLARGGALIATQAGDIVAMTDALVFARLAYARSQEAGDASVLLKLLSAAQLLADSAEHVDSLQAEAFAHISQLADSGDETAISGCPRWFKARPAVLQRGRRTSQRRLS